MGLSRKLVKAILGTNKKSKKLLKNAPEDGPDSRGSQIQSKKASSSAACWMLSKSGTHSFQDIEVNISEKDYGLAVAASTSATNEATAIAAEAILRLANVTSLPPHLALQHVKEEWAALRIQTTFRTCLARRQLRALKALVRVQAIVRGRIVRKQSIATLRSMQALVRVQSQAHQQRLHNSKDTTVLDQKTQERLKMEAYHKECEEGWCDQLGVDVKAKANQRQIAAVKRERALTYALNNQWRPPNSARNANNSTDEEETQKAASSSLISWTWLDWWMKTRPWENRALTDVDHALNPCMDHAQEDTKKKNVNQKANGATKLSSMNKNKLSKGGSSRASTVLTSSFNGSTTSSNGKCSTDSKQAYIPKTPTNNRHLKCNSMKDSLTRPIPSKKKSAIADIHSRRKISIVGIGKLAHQNSGKNLKNVPSTTKRQLSGASSKTSSYTQS